MLREAATPEMAREWKRTWEAWHGRLAPNRISGAELVAYLRARYPLREAPGECRVRVVSESVLANDFSREKLAPGQMPRPTTFFVEDAGTGHALYARRDARDGTGRIFVGIDLSTGEFHVEGSARLWDELFFRRGLDAADLQNPFLVSEYVAQLQRGAEFK